MATRRRVLTAAGAIAITAVSAPRIVRAQTRGQQPGADTPRILIATCHTPTAGTSTLGVDVAEAVRSRVQQENSIRQLYVLSRNDINNYLTSSGYKADSALSVSDLKELAKLMRADEILDCTSAKTSSGVHVDSKLMLARDVSLAQPLAAVDAKDAGDAAKKVERELTDARKALPEYRRCESALRDQKWADAATAARAGLAKDPNSTLSRLCLMSAYQYGKSGPDSVLRVAEDIMRADSTNTLAMRNAVDAYMAEAPFKGRVPIFIGDDTMDYDGFVAVWRHAGLAIAVGSPLSITGASETPLNTTTSMNCVPLLAFWPVIARSLARASASLVTAMKVGNPPRLATSFSRLKPSVSTDGGSSMTIERTLSSCLA